jgi:RHS repeat-associated protein
MGSAQVFDTADSFDPRIADHDSTHFLLTYTTDPNFPGSSRYGSVDFGTRTITLNSEQTFKGSGTGDSDNSTDVVRVDTNKFVICYADANDSDDGKCIVGDWQQPEGNSAPIAPTSLLAEGQTNPTDISDPTPEFSAIYNDPDATSTAVSYQIQVSTSSAFVSAKWDSGKTSIASSTPPGMRIADITYSGSALASTTTYYWRIKFWDQLDASGAWSTATSTFSLATSTGGGGGGSGTSTAPFVQILQNISYEYDAGGNITQIIDASDTGAGKAVTYQYDDLSRLISASTTAASSSPYTYTYVYDALGNITNIYPSSPENPWTYTQSFDSLSASTTLNGQDSWGVGPNPSNFVVSTSYPYGGSGYSVQHTNFAESYIQRSITPITKGTVRAYMRKSGVDAAERFSLLSGSSYLVRVSLKCCGSVSNMGYATGTSTPAIQTYSPDQWYAVDVDFNTDTDRYRVRVDGGSWTAWSPFDQNRTASSVDGIMLEKEDGTEEAVYWDNIGPTPVSFSPGSTYTYAGTGYANPHAVTQIAGTSGTTTYTYDNNGNTTIAGAFRYTWDWRNRMTQAATGTATTTFGYDHNNDRVTLKVGSNATTTYSSKYFNRVGATTTVHIFLPDGTSIATIEGNGTATTTSYIHTDHLGGTGAVSDHVGHLSETTDYLPYGAQRVHTSNTGFTEQRKYAGTEYDPSSGLQYMQARYQDPTRGQFLSQDPAVVLLQARLLVDPQQLNFYSYGRGNPIRFLDQNGMAIEDFRGPFVPSNGTYKTGDIYGSYKGVNVYHNGGNYQCAFQCVEFADRFISQQWGVPSTAVANMVANGQDYTAATFNAAFGSDKQIYLTSYNNRVGNFLPTEDSIIAFGPSATNPYGHVGVIGAVNFNEEAGQGNIVIAHQNTKNFKTTLGLTRNSDGAYQVSGFAGMQAIGWTIQGNMTNIPNNSGREGSYSNTLSMLSRILGEASRILSALQSL